MQADPSPLAVLIRDVARFPIRDRKLAAAQDRLQRIYRSGAAPGDADVRRYLRALERYFTGFEREARTHLADLDRRLAAVAQLQFNLTAERGVATRRVELTQLILAKAAEVARR